MMAIVFALTLQGHSAEGVFFRWKELVWENKITEKCISRVKN